MSMTPISKSSATTMTVTSKNSVTMNPMIRAGQGWTYDQAGINYDGPTDVEGRQVLYDSLGTATTMTPLAKNQA